MAADMRTFKLARTAGSRAGATRWTLGSLVVKSLGGNAGAGFRRLHGTFELHEHRSIDELRSGVEFDFFPYRESNQHSLTVQYTVGTSDYKYRDVTIFNKLRETVPTHGFNVSLGLRAPWGSLGSYSSVSQHLNRRDRYRASIGQHRGQPVQGPFVQHACAV